VSVEKLTEEVAAGAGSSHLVSTRCGRGERLDADMVAEVVTRIR